MKELKLQQLREQKAPKMVPVGHPDAVGAGQHGKPPPGKWGKVNADQYLWNMGGGATPLNVQFGENAYVPSAVHLQSVQMQQKHFFGPPVVDSSHVYEEAEQQPGDLDYEYTRFWYSVAPALNPHRHEEVSECDSISISISIAKLF
jgi:hypothetical protein